MKTTPAAAEKQIPNWIQSGSPKAFLFCGQDEGRVAALLQNLSAAARKRYGSLDILQYDQAEAIKDPARIRDDLMSGSLLGGTSLCVITAATDRLTATIKTWDLQKCANLLVVTAAHLVTKSSLRSFFEQSPHAMLTHCYQEEGPQLNNTVRQLLNDKNYQPHPDSLHFIAQTCGSDYQILRQEIDKLDIYMGASGGNITLADAKAAIDGSAQDDMDGLIEAVFSRSPEAINTTLSLLEAQRIAPIAALRTLLFWFYRIQALRALIDEGQPLEAAMSKIRPPFLFYQSPLVQRHIQRWPAARLTAMIQRLLMAEKAAKANSSLGFATCQPYLMLAI